MITFNDKEFDISPEMLDGAINYVETFLSSLKGDAKTVAIEKLLGVGKSLVKKNAKAEREQELAHVKELVSGDVDFEEWAQKAAQAFRSATAKAMEYKDILGGVPMPKSNGDGYTITMPLLEFKPAEIIAFTGELDKVKILLNPDALDGATEPGSYHAYVEADLPDLDGDFAAFREARQKALDAAAVYTKNLTNYKSGLNPDGTFFLLDSSARVAGEKRESSGVHRSSGSATWNSKTYTGSPRAILNAAMQDGYKPAGHVQKWPAQILEGKVKGWSI